MNQRKKMGPSGPAKPAKRRPERRAIIAARRRRAGKPRRGPGAALSAWSRRVDRIANRGLERCYPALRRARLWILAAAALAGRLAGPPLRRAAALAGRARRLAWRLLRPALAAFFRLLALAERLLRAAAAAATAAARAGSVALSPPRALAAAIVVAGLALAAAQFADYRAVEVGQPGYAGLPEAASPPTVAVRTAGEAHAYLLAPLGALAAALGLAAMARDRRRLGLAPAALGAVALGVILLVDLPAGLDVGSQSSRFAGAAAVLRNGFYAELAAAGGLLFCGLLYYARPCRIPISSSGRAASGRRRKSRRRASSRARVARSA